MLIKGQDGGEDTTEDGQGEICEDEIATKKCEKKKAKGRCDRKYVKKNCQKTCGFCCKW